MKRSHRYITSLLMTLIYLLVIFSPLTSFARQTRLTGHIVAEECSGDCKTDGCSLERSAAHACCCWKKIQPGNLNAHRHSDTESSPSAHVPSREAHEKKAPCCDEPTDKSHHESASAAKPESPVPEKGSPIISSSTCGNGKQIIFLNFENSYHLPYFFSGTPSVPEDMLHTPVAPNPMASRCNDPPDHPPQVHPLS